MARSSYQKLKPLYIMKYLLQNTDEDHPVTVNQIISFLDSQGISAERKSIYSDVEALQYFGLDIVQAGSGRSCGYYVAHRNFELPELKLLVDSVQSSKFITHKKTATLIKKIETLASIHEAQLLNRQVFVKNRIKTMNESIYPHGFGSNLTMFTITDPERISEKAVANWENSPSHLATMIDPDCNTVGVGITVNNGRAFCYMFVGNPTANNPYA